jgi:hypothetical protein
MQIKIYISFFLLLFFYACSENDSDKETAITVTLLSDTTKQINNQPFIFFPVELYNNNSFSIWIENYGMAGACFNSYERISTSKNLSHLNTTSISKGVFEIKPKESKQGILQFFSPPAVTMNSKMVFTTVIEIARSNIAFRFPKAFLASNFLAKDSLLEYKTYPLLFYYYLEKDKNTYRITRIEIANDSILEKKLTSFD